MSTTADDPTTQPTLISPGDLSATWRNDPYRSFGIIGFVLAFFAVLNIAGLIISIIALVRSKRAGYRNRFALAGVVIAGLGVLTTLVIVAFVGSTLIDAAQTCARLGDGVHLVGTATYTCAPGSFYVGYPR